MPYTVLLTDSAARDLEELYNYISKNDSPENADRVLDKIEILIDKLSEFPERGVFPPELIELGIKEYREIFFKPYRIIYRVIAKKIYIYLIVDGRRDMETLLNRRILES